MWNLQEAVNDRDECFCVDQFSTEVIGVEAIFKIVPNNVGHCGSARISRIAEAAMEFLRWSDDDSLSARSSLWDAEIRMHGREDENNRYGGT
jgi:hypothetical protein